ncbi:MAG: excinuclease ABC subunit UvrA [Gemmatimonadota bacterium]
MSDKLVVRGAREHNLKDIDVELPRHRLVVITGLSGSGKSSLAFDTIYAEGQRRYVESLSAYARQFLGLMEKPDVDAIEGLSPAISIEQKTAARNPRSTVGTVTEIYDYLRLLYARVGSPHCHNCGRPITRQSVSQMVDTLLAWPGGTRIQILAPLVRGRKGEYRELFEEARREGFVRVRVDGKVYMLDALPKLAKTKKHSIEVVVDRAVIGPDARGRLADSLQTAARLGAGVVVVNRPDGKKEGDDTLLSEELACVYCGIGYAELEPRMFSFNSPYGACPACGGLGTRMEVDPDALVADPRISLLEGVILPWGEPRGHLAKTVLPGLAERYGFHLNTPWGKLPESVRRVLLFGTAEEEVQFRYRGQKYAGSYAAPWEGIVANLQKRWEETASAHVRQGIEAYMAELPCTACGGRRLKPESLAVTVGGRNIGDVTALSVRRALDFFRELAFGERDREVSRQILKEIGERLGFLVDVGLDYLTLDRSAASLSGGEAQRIRLATQIGSHLVGVLYILDEPSIGLHQRDNQRLLATLRRLRDLGNTVIVVEHDEETIRAADHVLDLGPRAGAHGGSVVAQGTPEEVEASPASITGAYLRGEKRIAVPSRRREGSGEALVVRGASANNLQEVDVTFPLGRFICLTGVSGSGKSTLMEDILYRALANHLSRARLRAGEHARVEGLEHVDKVIEIDQSAIGRPPRSNPATYTGLFQPIRDLFAQLPESRMRGYDQGRFSFNVKGGRCEACSGDGLVKIEMHFLPDVYVPCEVCRGRRYNRETLEVQYKGKSIADVLEMTVEEALEFFRRVPKVHRKLSTLADVGLGYVALGQSATTLSGGEAQRVKLATELARVSTGRTVYLLDEPTTGLHFEDTRLLLQVLHRLVDMGNTVVVIEHNLDVIKTADWIVDLGPEGGEQGGRVVAAGTPEEVALDEGSYTGRYLHAMLTARRARALAAVILLGGWSGGCGDDAPFNDPGQGDFVSDVDPADGAVVSEEKDLRNPVVGLDLDFFLGEGFGFGALRSFRYDGEDVTSQVQTIRDDLSPPEVVSLTFRPDEFTAGGHDVEVEYTDSRGTLHRVAWSFTVET